MSIPKLEFPALYHLGDQTSNGSQKIFLRYIKIEYVILILCAILIIDFTDNEYYYLAYIVVLLIGLAIQFLRSSKKPEESWYKARALAESVKTLTWRYCMKAPPFGPSLDAPSVREIFRGTLQDLLRDNKNISDASHLINSNNEQLTTSMDQIRELPWQNRLEIYRIDRIKDQKDWYNKKSLENKKLSDQWKLLSITIYVAAILFAILRFLGIEWATQVIDPLLVIASAMIGWIQIKKFNELASAYALASQEIGIVESTFRNVKSDDDLAKFVADAELAFSREHIQWTARRGLLDPKLNGIGGPPGV